MYICTGLSLWAYTMVSSTVPGYVPLDAKYTPNTIVNKPPNENVDSKDTIKANLLSEPYEDSLDKKLEKLKFGTFCNEC